MKSAKSSGQLKKLKHPLLLRRVNGNSMLPNLSPGKIVVASSFSKIRVGRAVIFSDQGKDKIKRVAKLEDDKVYLLGDNPKESTDSRQIGWLPSNRVLASVIWPSI